MCATPVANTTTGKFPQQILAAITAQPAPRVLRHAPGKFETRVGEFLGNQFLIRRFLYRTGIAEPPEVDQRFEGPVPGPAGQFENLCSHS